MYIKRIEVAQVLITGIISGMATSFYPISAPQCALYTS